MLAYIFAFSVGYYAAKDNWFSTIFQGFSQLFELYNFFEEMEGEKATMFGTVKDVSAFLFEYVCVRAEQWVRQSVVHEVEDIYVVTYVLGNQTYKLRARRIGGPAARNMSAFERGQKSLIVSKQE